MNKHYIVGGHYRRFSLKDALAKADEIFRRKGVIAAVEEVAASAPVKEDK